MENNENQQRIEILVDSPKTAESLLSLLLSDAVREMLSRTGGAIQGAAVVNSDAGLLKEDEDGEE